MNEIKKKRYTVSYIYNFNEYFFDENGIMDDTIFPIFIDDIDIAKKVYNSAESCYPIQLNELIGDNDWGEDAWESHFGNSTLLASK